MAEKNGKDGGNIIFLNDFKKSEEGAHPDDDVVTHSVTMDFTKAAWEHFNRISKYAEGAMGAGPKEGEIDPVVLIDSGLRLYEKLCEELAKGNTFAVVRRKKRWAIFDRIFGTKYEVIGTYVRTRED